MATMVLGEVLTINVVDPGTQQVGKQSMQRRTFEAFRNKGFVLLHTPDFDPLAPLPIDPTTKRHVTRPVSHNSVVVEFFDDLKRYHRPAYTYALHNRLSYNVRSFTTALGICAEPSEPFRAASELLRFREYEVVVGYQERELISKWKTEPTNRWKTAGIQTLRADALMGNEHASAFITSCDALTEASLQAFHNQCHFTYFFTQQTKEPRYTALFRPFFAKPVHLYCGVATPPTAAVRQLAAECGVKLLIRGGFHYRMLR